MERVDDQFQNEVEFISESGVYPNPIGAGNTAYIQGIAKGDYQLYFYDLKGVEVLPAQAIQLERREVVGVVIPSFLARGTYIVRIEGRDSTKSFKISVL